MYFGGKIEIKIVREGPDVVHKRCEQRYWTLSLLRTGWASGRLYSRGPGDQRRYFRCGGGGYLLMVDGFRQIANRGAALKGRAVVLWWLLLYRRR